jgi:hypothetical protein
MAPEDARFERAHPGAIVECMKGENRQVCGAHLAVAPTPATALRPMPSVAANGRKLGFREDNPPEIRS